MTQMSSRNSKRADLDAKLKSIAPLTAAEARLADSLLAQGLLPEQIVAAIVEARMRAVMEPVVAANEPDDDDDPGPTPLNRPRHSP